MIGPARVNNRGRVLGRACKSEVANGSWRKFPEEEKIMRQLKAICVVCLLVVLTVACGTAATTAPPATQVPGATQPPAATQAPAATQQPTAAEQVELNIWTWRYKQTNDFVQGRIDAFQKEHPNVKVTYSTFPGTGEGGYDDKLLASLSTGTGPDVFWIQAVQTPRYASLKQIQPIDDAALKAMGFSSMDDLFKKYDYRPNALDGWSHGGNRYALLQEVSWNNLFANTDCMKDSGLDPATVKVDNWDEVIAAAEKMSRFDPSGKFTRNGFLLPTAGDDNYTMQTLSTFLPQTGGSVLSPDGKEAWINKPEAIKALQMMVKLTRGSKAGSPDFGSPGIGGLYTDWLAAKNTCMSLWHPPMYRGAIKGQPIEGHYAVYPIPTMPDGGKGTVFWGWGWVVNANSKHQDLAWQLVHTGTDDFEANCTQAGNWLPLVHIADSPCVQSDPGRVGLMASLDRNPQFMFSSVYYPEISRIVRKYYELVIFQGNDLQQSMDQAAKEINDVLKRGQ